MIVQPAGRRPATVLTFYSYIGGLGSTMSVANMAWLLAAAGRRVLVIDWDLDSPGLRPYFRPLLATDPPSHAGGLIGLVSGFSSHSPGTTMADIGAPFDSALPAATAASSGPAASGDAQTLPEVSGGTVPVPSAADELDLAGHVISVPVGFPEGGSIDFLGPGDRSGGGPDSRPSGSSGIDWTGWSSLYPKVDVPLFARALRAALRTSDYDYVLVDSPAGRTLSTDACLTQLPDIVVLGYRLTQQSIRDTAALALEIKNFVPRTIRVLPVAMRVGAIRHQTRDTMFQLARRRFDGVLRDLPAEELDAYWERARIPEHPEYSSDDLLAVLGEQLDGTAGLGRALAGLIEILTEGEVVSPVIPDDLRTRYRDALDRLHPPVEPTTCVVYAPLERAWADWIRAELERAGVQIERPPTGSEAFPVDSVIVIGSAQLAGLPAAERVARAVPGSNRLIGVRVAEADTYGVLAPGHSIDLRHLPEEEARSLLLEQFGGLRADALPPAPLVSPRFPGRSPEIFQTPNRNPAFVGRDIAMEDLRNRLGRGSLVAGMRPYLLHGEPGTGKSQVALEYVHRFASDYDLVWWIPAQREADIREALTQLAHQLLGRVPADAVGTVLEELATGTTHRNWLLVYDNADDATALAGLMPSGSRTGHVIVTSRSAVGAAGPEGEMREFPRQETLRLIHLRVTGIDADQAGRLAEATHDLPLTVELAAMCVQEDASRLRRRGDYEATAIEAAIEEYLDRLTERLGEMERDPTPGALPTSALSAVMLSVDSLLAEEHGQIALRLVEAAAFLSPEGVDRRLLYSPLMLRLLTEPEPALQDTILLDSVLTKISRYALGTVEYGRHQAFRMHRLTQDLLRARLSPDRRDDLRAEVLAVLASFAPAEADYDAPYHVATFAELQRHLLVSGALKSTDDRVRRWVAGQIHYLWRTDDRGNWRFAHETGERLLAEWRSRFGPDDPLVLRLAGQLANVCRSLGDIVRAADLDEETLSRQRRTLGLQHPRTLMTALGHGDDLRSLGRFEEAYTEDQATWDGCRLTLGEDHPVTASSANNLAISLLLVGAPREALALELRNHDQRMRLFGQHEVATWRSARRAGSLLRELGDYEGSRLRLSEALTKLEDLAGKESLEALRAAKSLGVTQRCLGDAGRAMELHTLVLQRYERFHGPSHRGALATALAMAGDLYALGRFPDAVERARWALARYREVFGPEHPFTQICRSDLAIYLRAVGAADEALTMSGQALESLQRSLDDRHTYVLATAIGHANNLVAVGQPEAARQFDEATNDRYLSTFGPDHPGVKITKHNLEAGFLPEDSGKRHDLDIEQPLA
jgi:tetratricopeptide (TPR) repeat protein